MTPENMTIDELAASGIESSDPICRELCKRLSGTSGHRHHIDESGAIGRTVRDIKDHIDKIVIRFLDGAYLVIEGEVYDGDVDFTIGRALIKSEMFDCELLTPAEVAEWKQAQAAEKERRDAATIDRLRRELAELEK